MAKVKFLFDAERDCFNHWRICNEPEKYGNNLEGKISKKLMEIARGKKFQECKNDILLFNKGIYESELIQVFLEALEKAWIGIEEVFFKKLENITGVKFEEDLTCYITTAFRCPYNADENSFMVSLFSSIPNSLKNCGHEILHIHFHKNYFEKVEKELGNEKAHILKEALTVLLNEEFKGLWFSYDEGYLKHKELRDFISERWRQDKNFEKLILDGVSFLKDKTNKNL